jgi:hypothetical protein
MADLATDGCLDVSNENLRSGISVSQPAASADGKPAVPDEAAPAPPSDMWQSISTAPFNLDLELAVLDKDGPHALVFPCQRTLTGWVKSRTQQRIEVSPTHWREWDRENI